MPNAFFSLGARLDAVDFDAELAGDSADHARLLFSVATYF